MYIKLANNPRALAFLKMSTKISMDVIKANATKTRENIELLKSELNSLTEAFLGIRVQQLREENAKLNAAVLAAKDKLIAAETANQVPQIAVPEMGASPKPHPPPEQAHNPLSKPITEVIPQSVTEKPKKEKKAKKESQPQVPDGPIDIGRLDLRVAKIVQVKRHPDADTLYQLSINCGEEKPRTVCSGLVKHIVLEELENRDVLLLCNLKPAKMRGVLSEAMVMCASAADKVEVLCPPEGCIPGEFVECEGFTRQPDAVMNPKKKIFETVAPDLHTNDNFEACYKGIQLKVPGKGVFTAKTLKNVAVK